jgi:uncharacterized protein involved in response to NO
MINRFENPFRLFFPLGWLLGMAGVLLWPLMLSGAITVYPKEIHADAMMGGFLILFVAGFLMTALPRFAGTFDLERGELFLFLSSAIVLVITIFFQNRLPFHAALLITLVFLFLFCIRRIRNRTTLPPPPLIFAFAGLAGGILSLSCLLLHDLTGGATVWLSVSRLFFYQGLQLCLVLGVGIFLIPNLLGHPTCTPPVTIGVRTPGSQHLPYLRFVPKPLWIVIGLFFVSFYFQAAYSERVGTAIRAAILALVSFHDWKIYRLPPVRSTVSIALWISCWLLLAGLWLQVVRPAYDIHARHLIYIGGFGLMTLMIATRVILAHGGHNMMLEKRSRLLKGAVALVLLATFTRVIARLFPETVYLHHLAYAAWAWIAGLILWGLLILPKMVRMRSGPESAA